VSAKYEFIDGEEGNYPMSKMFAWAGVSSSGFYEWRNRGASATARRREELKPIIAAIFADSDGTYGYRRIHAVLGRSQIPAGLELVRALMRQLGLVPCQPKPWRPITTIAGDAAAVPDLVQRDFSAPEPGTKLVGDITYIRTWEGWLYLASVIDCATKACIGYAMADHMRTSLIVDALDVAASAYDITGAIFHSDRGTQYMSQDFATAARKYHLRRSVGRTGVCYDNAQAETFNAAVKVERVNRTQYPTREHARKDVTRYIEFRYNRKRLHSGLGYRTPEEAYSDFIETRNAA
jgi:transposase InsO family protein